MKRITVLMLLGCFVALSRAKKEARYQTETIDGVKVVHNLSVKPEKVLKRLRFVVISPLPGGEKSVRFAAFYGLSACFPPASTILNSI